MTAQQYNSIKMTFTSFFIAALVILFVSLSLTSTAQAYHYPWDQGHDTTDWDNPDEAGPPNKPQNNSCNGTGSPVYSATGDFLWNEIDVTLNGRPSISIKRTYNSHDPRDGLFGNGWNSNCETFFIKVKNNDNSYSYILRVPNGKRYEYKQKEGKYIAPASRFDSVQTLDKGIVRLNNQNGGYREFNTKGKITTSVDSNGNAIVFSYDTSGKLTKKSSGTRFISLHYDSSGRIASLQDHSKRKWTYAYDVDGNLISVTDPLSGVRQYEYLAYNSASDGFNYQQLTKVTDASGVVLTTVTYTDRRVSSYTNGANTYTYQYSLDTKKVTKTDNGYGSSSVIYNDDQIITQRTDQLSNTVKYVYDDHANVTQYTDQANNSWLATFDKKGRKLTAKTPLGHISKWEYHKDTNKPTKLISAEGNTILITYDDKLNPTNITDAKGNKSSISYDAKGNITSITDGKGNKTSLSYNADNLVVSVKDANNNSTSINYDALGRKKSTTDAEGRKTSYAYDALGRLLKTTNALGHITSYHYDKAGRLLTFTDPVGNVTQSRYDSYGRLSKTIRPDTKETTYTYNTTNQVSSIARYDGKTISYSYDYTKKLTSQSVGAETSYISYDKRSYPLTLQNSTGTISNTYDKEGNLIKEVDTFTGKTINRSYNKDGILSQLKALGETLTYSRDKNNGLASLINGNDTFNFTYDANSILTSIALPNNQKERYQYDKLYNLTQLKSGTTTLDYSHDKTGLITNKTRSGASNGASNDNYTYDTIARLTQAGNQSYTYDNAGNNQNNGAKYHTKTNQLSEDNTYSYTYDASGNISQKKKKDNSETKNYTFNDRNQLTKVEVLDSANLVQTNQTLIFSYDAKGRRASKTVGTDTTRYVYDDNAIIGILDNSNTVQSTLIHQESIDKPLSIKTAGSSYYYHRNHQGSIIALSDSTGAVVESYTYDAYGNTTKTGTTLTGNPYAYTGRELDTADLYYYRARYYDPKAQRFLSEDPIGFSSGDYNFYRYVGGNPTNFTDPLGMEISGTWGMPSVTNISWDYTGITPNLERGPNGNDLVDRIGYFNFLISGILSAQVNCTETDDCDNEIRSWAISGSVSVNDLPFSVPYDEPAIPIPGMTYVIWADKVFNVGQYTKKWKGMIKAAAQALLNSPSLVCKGHSFVK